MTVAAYWARWERSHARRLAPNSRRAYRGAWERHVLPALGDRELAQVDRPAVRELLGAVLAAGRAPATAQAVHHALSSVLTDATLDGLLEANPAAGAGKRLWPRLGETHRKALNAGELARLLAAADAQRPAWMAQLVRVIYRTGLRLGEALALEARSLRLSEALMSVERTYHGRGIYGPPKSRRRRLVDCSPQTVRLLGQLVAAHPQGPLFPSARAPRRPLHPGTVDHALRALVLEAGLPTTITVHGLRHTYASRLVAAGYPLPWIQQQLGHRHFAMTVDLYGSGLPEHHPDWVAVLDDDPPPHHRPLRPAVPVRLRRRTA